MSAFHETQARAFLKAISWRVIATFTTMLLAYLITGSMEATYAIGIADVLAKLVFFYFHERAWDRVDVGRVVESDCPASKPFVLWFTGLPCSGKSTLAEKIYAEIRDRGCPVQMLDGDTVRTALSQDDFSEAGRNQHIRYVGLMASTLEKQGISVIASFVSPHKESRDYVRSICENFALIYVSTPAQECEKRDVKGMYKKARAGEIENFTGVNAPYEVPLEADLVLETSTQSVEQSLEIIRSYLGQLQP